MEPLEDEDNVLVQLPHHIQQDVCTTRPQYRRGRKLTAVKVYTVNNESVHLLVYRVPAINLKDELETLCSRFGQVAELYKLELVDPGEEFTEIYHVCYSRIRQARKAKRELDGRSFYGGLLHVCYAPELETVEQTRAKLINRRNEVAYFSGRKFRVAHIRSKSNFQSKPKFQRRECRANLLTNQQLALQTAERPSDSNNPSKLSHSSASTSTATAEVSRPLAPYDLPAPSYPSSETRILPGHEVKRARDVQFASSAVVKRLKLNATNRIVFHKKNLI